MLVKGGKGKQFDAFEISCALHVEELSTVQYMRFPSPLSVCLEIFLKESSLPVPQEEAPSPKSLVEELATMSESLEKQVLF